MKKIFIIIALLFSFVWFTPTILSLALDIKEGNTVDFFDIGFLIFGVIFFFALFSRIIGKKQTNIQKNTLLSKNEKENLRKNANRVSTRFLKLDLDVIETSDPRAAYLVVQDKPFGREYKTIVLLNNKEIKNILEGKEFFVYLDTENPDKYFIDFSDLTEEINKGDMYLPLA